MLNILAGRDTNPPAEDRALFVRELCRLTADTRSLYRVTAQQTSFLSRLTIDPRLLADTWSRHFGLLTDLVYLPEIRQSRLKIPRKAIVAVMSAGRRLCAGDFKSRETAGDAVGLVGTMCYVARTNHTLMHAVKAGLFDLLCELDDMLDRRTIAQIVPLFCSCLLTAKVMHAFSQRYAFPLAVGGPRRPSPTWRDIAETFNLYHVLYIRSFQEKSWRRSMPCWNVQGPHHDMVRICPCGAHAYCSGSCQRMHWNAGHRRECSYASFDGPCGLQGAVSLSDIIYISNIVQEYVSLARAEMAQRLEPLFEQASDTEQAIIRLDLTEVSACAAV